MAELGAWSESGEVYRCSRFGLYLDDTSLILICYPGETGVMLRNGRVSGGTGRGARGVARVGWWSFPVRQRSLGFQMRLNSLKHWSPCPVCWNVGSRAPGS
jgi:hypothetical protein